MKVIIDGPTSGVPRQVISLKWVNLTSQKVAISRGAGTGAIKKALEKNNAVATWEATNWGKKIRGHQIKASLNDFGRFKARMARKVVCVYSHILYYIAEKNV